MDQCNGNLKLNPVILVECCFAFVILVCIVIGFAGNGIRINGSSRYMTSIGLWYETLCTEHGGCSSESLKEKYDDGETSESTYYGEIVYWQVIVTLSLSFAGLIGLFYILTIVKVIDQRKIRPLVLVLCIIIGGLLLLMAVSEGTRQVIRHVHEIQALHFPWSLFFLAVAGVFAVILGTLNILMMDCKRREVYIDSNSVWKPFPFVLEFILMLVSFVFQIAIHGGDGMAIVERQISNTIKNGTDIFHRTTNQRIGIWYITFCNGTECRKMSRKQHNVLFNGDNDFFYDMTEAFSIEFSITMVMVAGSTLAAMILYGVGLKKRTNTFTYHIRMYILTCAMVAAVIGIDVCAFEARWQQLITKEDTIPKYTYHFPWGLLLLGLSAVIDLVVAGMNLIVLSCQNNRHEYENTQHVQLSHTYISPNTYDVKTSQSVDLND